MRKKADRNTEILKMWQAGKTYKEIGLRFGITDVRAMQICKREAQKATGLQGMKPKAMRNEMRKECGYIIKNGAAEVFLTAIDTVQGHPLIYRYGSRDPKEAMRFTKDEAEEIARKRHAVVCVLG